MRRVDLESSGTCRLFGYYMLEPKIQCLRLLCQREMSRGRVEEAKTVCTGFVVPSRYAELLSSMDAVKSVSPLRLKYIALPVIFTMKPLCLVKKRTDSRLFRRLGTWRTRVNCIGCISDPFTLGINTTDPIPAE